MQKLLNAVLNHADCSQSGLLTLVLTLLAVNKILLSPYYYGPGLDGKEKVLNNFQVLSCAGTSGGIRPAQRSPLNYWT